MKTRLFLVVLCLFLLPICFAGTSSQFSAYASGYVIAYGELIPCECEEGPGYHEDCVCESDTSNARATGSNAVTDSGKAHGGLGAEALFALAAIMLWLRFKP